MVAKVFIYFPSFLVTSSSFPESGYYPLPFPLLLMTYICPVCQKKWRNGQNSIECSSCNQWIHHNNRTNCSGLTNSEFEIHHNDENKPYECDVCMSKANAKTFFTLPFANPDDHDHFSNGKQLNYYDDLVLKSLEVKFILQCESIQNLFNNIENDDDNDELPSPVNSKYFDLKELNSLKLDLPSSFGLFHVNIASLN